MRDWWGYDTLGKTQWRCVRSKSLHAYVRGCGDDIDGIAMWLCKSPFD